MQRALGLCAAGASLFVASCGARETPPSAAASRADVVVSASARRDLALPPPTPCELLAREQRSAFRPFFDELRKDGGDVDPRQLLRDYCWPDERGAWGLAFSDVVVKPGELVKIPWRNETPAELKGRVTVVRADLAGRRLAGGSRAFELSKPLDGRTFDWSGDGVPELVFPAENQWTLPELEVWTTTGVGVAPYPAAVALHAREVADVDADGRPDLFYTAPFSGELKVYEDTDVARFATPAEGGFWLVAHSLADGTFARDDEVARTYAKRACPSAALSAARAPSLEEDAVPSAALVRCARLWGVARAVVEKAIDRRCKKPAGCLNEKLLRAWATVTPPLTLQ